MKIRNIFMFALLSSSLAILSAVIIIIMTQAGYISSCSTNYSSTTPDASVKYEIDYCTPANELYVEDRKLNFEHTFKQPSKSIYSIPLFFVVDDENLQDPPFYYSPDGSTIVGYRFGKAGIIAYQRDRRQFFRLSQLNNVTEDFLIPESLVGNERKLKLITIISGCAWLESANRSAIDRLLKSHRANVVAAVKQQVPNVADLERQCVK